MKRKKIKVAEYVIVTKYGDKIYYPVYAYLVWREVT